MCMIHINAPAGAYLLEDDFLSWHTFNGYYEPILDLRRKKHERIADFKARARKYAKGKNKKIYAWKTIMRLTMKNIRAQEGG